MDDVKGYAASRSQVSGLFDQPGEKNYGAEKVSVFFLFSHLAQRHGFDSIPKFQNQGIPDFNNIFRDALTELSNVGQYTTFVEMPGDVNLPKRRQEIEEDRKTHAYTIEISFFEESSFKQQCFSGLIALLSLSAIPMPYSWDYTITANVNDQLGRMLHSYTRQATLDNWVEVFLMFAYPFHPLEGKREAIYAESLHDIFKQIESE